MTFNIPLGGGINPFKTRREKFGIGSLLVLLLIGAVITGFGVVIYNSARINPNWTKVDGKVVSVNTDSSGSGNTYSPVVSYQANGQTYKVASSSSTSSYPQIGSTKQVAYDPAAPADAKVVSSGFISAFILVLLGIGVFLILLAPVLFVRSLRRSKDISKLKGSGQKVAGVITDIQSVSNGGNNQGSKYRIVVSATGLSGTVQNYTSDWVTGIGGLAMTDYRQNPVPIDIYINPTNPDDYYVDISEIPNITPERIMQLVKSHQAQSVPVGTSAQPSPDTQPATSGTTLSPSQPPTVPPAPTV